LKVEKAHYLGDAQPEMALFYHFFLEEKTVCRRVLLYKLLSSSEKEGDNLKTSKKKRKSPTG